MCVKPEKALHEYFQFYLIMQVQPTDIAAYLSAMMLNASKINNKVAVWQRRNRGTASSLCLVGKDSNCSVSICSTGLLHAAHQIVRKGSWEHRGERKKS